MRACRIRHTISPGGYRNAEWPAIHTAMVDAMTMPEKANLPKVATLPDFPDTQ